MWLKLTNNLCLDVSDNCLGNEATKCDINSSRYDSTILRLLDSLDSPKKKDLVIIWDQSIEAVVEKFRDLLTRRSYPPV